MNRDGKEKDWIRRLRESDPSEVRKQLLAEQPQLKNAIQSKIGRLLDLAGTYDPLPFVSRVALKNSVFTLEDHLSGDDHSSSVRTEYALSIALSVAESLRPEPGAALVEEFARLVEEVIRLCSQYFITDSMDPDKYSPPEAELRQALLTSSLNVRGDAYLEHKMSLVLSLFEPHDDLLGKATGYRTQDYLDFLLEVDKQITDAFSTCDEIQRRVASLRSELGRRGLTDPEEGTELPDDLATECREIERITNALPAPFQIVPSARAPAKLMDQVASRMGDNEALGKVPAKMPAWPTNDSVVYERPLLERAGKYYAYLPSALAEQLIAILEGIIRRCDKVYFQTTYSERRGKVVERLALEQLARLLPGSAVHGSAHYTIDGERYECDGLLLYGRTLFVAEMKAGSIAAATLRGGIDSIRNDVKSLIAEAHGQAARVRNFIRCAPTARFESQDGSEIVTIKSADIDDIFSVNVTLSHLGILSTKLNVVAGLNLLRDRTWPWTVALTNLQVVADILEGPSEFLAYIKRRLQVNDIAAVTTIDENDLLMAFLTQGLEFPEAAQDIHVLLLNNLTLALDHYYISRHSGKDVPKPRVLLPESLRRLFRGLETLGPDGSALAADILLLPRRRLGELGLQLDEMEKDTERTGAPHDLSVIHALPYGLTVGVARQGDESALTKLRRVVELLKYQHRADRWVVIGIVCGPEGTSGYEALTVVSPWRHTDAMQHAVEEQFGPEDP
jgi:hypothetical protein